MNYAQKLLIGNEIPLILEMIEVECRNDSLFNNAILIYEFVSRNKDDIFF